MRNSLLSKTLGAKAQGVFAFAVLLMGLLLSTASFFAVRDWELASIDAAFRFRAHNALALLQRELDRHVETMNATAALYPVHDPERGNGFPEYAQHLLRQHGDIEVFYWAPKVTSRQRAAFEAEVRAQGRAGYQIWERSALDRRRPAAARSHYFPLLMAIPQPRGESPLGYDLAFNPATAADLMKAGNTGEPLMAHADPALLASKQSAHAALYRALYAKGAPIDTIEQRRQALTGYLLQIINVGVMMEEAYRGTVPMGLDFGLYEHRADGTRERIYSHSSPTRSSSAANLPTTAQHLSWEGELKVPGPRWFVKFSPAPAFLAANPIWRPWAVLAAGLIFTLGLTINLLILARRARHVEHLALQLTETNEHLRHQISQRREAEQTIAESELRHRLLFETMAQGALYINGDGIITAANAAAERILEVKAEHVVGKTCGEFGLNTIHEDGSPFFSEEYPAPVALRTGSAVTDVIMGLRTPSGSLKWVLVSAVPQFQPGRAAPYQVYATFSDITEHMQAEVQMRKLSRALEQTADAVMISDHNGVIEYVNPAFESMTGYGRAEVAGKTSALLKSGRHDTAFYRHLWETILKGESFHDVVINRKKDGSLYYEEKTITPIRAANGAITHFVSTGKDNTERMQAEDRLHYLANHDVLTGLPNKALFMERLRHALKKRAGQRQQGAVLFLDMDNFSIVNDSLGHDAGDSLLQAAAKRIAPCVREGDTLARFGGDDFVVLLESVAGADDVAAVAQSMLNSLNRSFTVGEHELFITASIGASLFPTDGDNAGALLKQADAAMYRAKDKGRNRFEFYSAELSDQTLRRLSLETQLRRAIENEEFVLHYQPQVTLAGDIFGAEALIRWQHPERGMISPLDFIPILEETGLIVLVGEWILHAACEQARAWEEAQLAGLRMSVNLSGKQFEDPRLYKAIGDVLTKFALPAERLELEITESVLMQNGTVSLHNMRELENLGVRLAIDDFGTGYSSLSYLKRFRVDTIKVDRSFVREVPQDTDDAEILRAIIAMAHGLRLTVIAEGVETSEQLAFLRNIGCDAMQGYLFSRPLPGAAATALLLEHAGRAVGFARG